MKVTDWTVYTPDREFHVFLEVHTDQGVSGWGAAFSQKSQVLGSLEWLKRFVVGENPLEVEPARISEIRVLQTVVGGRTTYEGRWASAGPCPLGT